MDSHTPVEAKETDLLKILRKVRVRQWAPLFALGMGGAACWLGTAFGQPNSWWWWSGGVLCAGGIILVIALRLRRTP